MDTRQPNEIGETVLHQTADLRFQLPPQSPILFRAAGIQLRLVAFRGLIAGLIEPGPRIANALRAVTEPYTASSGTVSYR
jgi:hypothetical protein